MNIFWIMLLLIATICMAAIGSGTNEVAFACALMFFPCALALYFSPAWIAIIRKVPAANQILVLNFFAGWTLIGWVVALVWAHAPVKAEAQS